MNRFHLPLFSLLLVVILAGAGCLGPDTARDNLEVGDTYKVPEVESKLDLDLPSDAEITVVLENSAAYSVSFLTSLSVHDTKAFFAETLLEDGYTAKRQFGSLPTDGPTHTSALYQKGGEVLSIGISIRGNKTEVSMER
ncbi:hypothetical protein HQ524_01875 [Candidatus Uhrbacteria bacterium]|nr:hypothetical protein [Candidatus Uhrbacteria bacterium]